MNSLQQLNLYSLTQIEFVDNRATRVIFDTVPAANQSITFFENGSHVVPVGINIEEIVNPEVANVTYVIDLSSITGQSSLFLDSIPAGVSVVESPQNVFSITGIVNAVIWQEVNQPTILLPFATSGVQTYTAAVNYTLDDLTTASQSWTVTTNIVQTEYISESNRITFYTNSTQLLDAPNIIADEVEFNPTWTMQIRPSVTTVVTNMSSTVGGTYNSTTGYFTITGNKAFVNSVLDAVDISFGNNDLNFVLNYVLTNNLNATQETSSQLVRSMDLIQTVNAASSIVIDPDNVITAATANLSATTTVSADNVKILGLSITLPAISQTAATGTGTFVPRSVSAAISAQSTLSGTLTLAPPIIVFGTGAGGIRSSNISTSSWNITVPNSALTGDLLMLLGVAIDDRSVTPPNGWTEIADFLSAGFFGGHVFYKFATAEDSGGTNYSYTPSSSGRYLNECFVIRRGKTPIISATSTSSNGTISTQAITDFTSSNNMYLSFVAGRQNAGSVTGVTIPNEMTQVRFLQDPNPGILALSRLTTVAFSYNPGDWVITASTPPNLIGWTIRC